MERDAIYTTVVGHANDFTTYINSLLKQNRPDIEWQVVFLTKHSEQVFQKPLASGIAYPTENVAKL
jgi:hypothetical protein